MGTVLQRQYESSLIHGANAPYVEALYEAYLEDPGRVPREWRRYFAEMAGAGEDIAHTPIVRALGQRLAQSPLAQANGGQEADAHTSQASQKQAAVSRLIQVYSLRGHQIADLDPLGLWERNVPAVLKLDFLGIEEGDLDEEF